MVDCIQSRGLELYYKIVNQMKIDCVSGLNLNKYSEKRVRKMHVLWIMLSKTRALNISMLRLESCFPPLSKFLATRLLVALLAMLLICDLSKIE